MPPPKPTRFCTARRRVCRQCEKRYPQFHTNDVCMECGESMICGAATVKGFSECQNHRGPNPNKGQYGMDHDLNKFPIVKLAERYRAVVKDARILSLRGAIEVIRQRIANLAERIDMKDAPDRMARLNKYWVDYLQAKNDMDNAGMTVLQKQITEEFERGHDDYAAWNAMVQALDLERKLVGDEVKIIKEVRGILTAEDAHELVAKMLSIILRVFRDDKVKLRQVKYEFIRMIGDTPTMDASEPLGDEDEQEDDVINVQEL